MKTLKNIILLVAIATVMAFITSCSKLNRIEGNSSIRSEIRNSVSFNRVENEGTFNVYIISDTSFFIEIEAESNLIPHIRTTVHGNVLEVSTNETLDNNYAMNLFVHTPVLEGVELSGSGLVDVGYFESATFGATLSGSGTILGDVKAVNFNSNLSGSGEIDFIINSTNTHASISGSGNIVLAGSCYKGNYNISGSGNIEAYALPIHECDAKISGSGNIFTEVSDVLDVTISGSGNLYYRGTPIVVTNITGSGQVIGQ